MQADLEIANQFKNLLKKQGIKFKLGTKVTASEVTENGVKLTMESAKGASRVGSGVHFVFCLIVPSSLRWQAGNHGD